MHSRQTLRFDVIALSIGVAAFFEVPEAPRQALNSSFEAGFRFALDSLDLDRVRPGETDAIEGLADFPEIDAGTVSDGRKVPVLEPPAVVLEVDVSYQVLHLFELGHRIGAGVVVGDVACVAIY